MCPALPILCVLLSAVPVLDTLFVQVAPPRVGAERRRTPGQRRAVLLIHGLYFHPISKTEVARSRLHSWQKPDSLLVQRLAREADVFAFSYAQTVAADEIAACPDLETDLRLLRLMGYAEIVLVGHSAGGVIAREFVEDHPDCGVTKVIQVCAPNAGSGWATWQTVRANQLDFLGSLTRTARRRSLYARADRQIPRQVEFACVVATGAVTGDGVVSTGSQYSADLRRQGVPAYPLISTHWMVLRSARGAELVARLVAETQPRWDARQVEAVSRRLLVD